MAPKGRFCSGVKEPFSEQNILNIQRTIFHSGTFYCIDKDVKFQNQNTWIASVCQDNIVCIVCEELSNFCINKTVIFYQYLCAVYFYVYRRVVSSF